MTKIVLVPTLDSDCIMIKYSLDTLEPTIWIRDKTFRKIRRFPVGWFNWGGLFDRLEPEYGEWQEYYNPLKKDEE